MTVEIIKSNGGANEEPTEKDFTAEVIEIVNRVSKEVELFELVEIAVRAALQVRFSREDRPIL